MKFGFAFVPDFRDYKRPGIYLVVLSESGYSSWGIDGGFVWDDADNDFHAYPELHRIVSTIIERNHAYTQRTSEET